MCVLVEHMGCSDNLVIIDSFRLGKAGSGKPRPIKITFSTKNITASVLSKTAKLKELKNEGLNIYIKPDKSKGEVAEFQRLGKRKDELLKDYPSVDEENPRVTLQKGSLKVDGVEVDKYEPVQTLF